MSQFETRADNEARLGQWLRELTVENVASWIWSNIVNPTDAYPILSALRQAPGSNLDLPT